MSTTIHLQPESIRSAICTYITQELAYDQAGLTFTNDFKLVEQGVIDSMGILRLITFIEENFNLTFAPEDLRLENFVTPDAITAFIVDKLAHVHA